MPFPFELGKSIRLGRIHGGEILDTTRALACAGKRSLSSFPLTYGYSNVDVLSDALNVVRLAGAVFFTATFSSRWAIASPDREDLARFLQLPSHCITLFHILAAGRGRVRFEDSNPIPIEAGDVVVFSHGTAHEMGSDLDTIPQSISAILSALPGEKIPQIKIGGGGPIAHFICGYVHCEQQFNPLLESLPRLLVIRAPASQPAATDGPPESNVVYVQAGEWLEMTRRYIIQAVL